MAENEVQEEEAPKSSKKLIIILIAIIVLLIAGGIVGFFMLKADTTAQAVEAGEPAAQQEVKKELLYYTMSKPFIVDFPQNSAARLVQVSIALQVEGEEPIEALKKHEPMIRNNLLMLINSQDPAELQNREGKEKLRQAMLEEVNAVLKKMADGEQVQEVFFTAFVMQ